jgi:multiple sugar transport system substrate-binding protein
MTVTRRRFLIGTGLVAAGTTLELAGCAPAANRNTGGGAGTLAVAWWGNPTRNKNTNDAIAAYGKAHSDLKITGQPGEFSTYWDKLATQVAGNSAPDLIQMDVAYISEYGTRGALLDLEKNGADVSKFAEGTVDAGRVGGKLVGINLGINTWAIAANPKVFQKANVAMPDDTTWTWDTLMQTSAEVAAKAGVFGLSSFFNWEPAFGTFLRQIGKEEFTEKALGFDAGDAQQFFDLMVKFQKAKAIPDAAAYTEDAGKALDQAAFGTGKSAMTGQVNSNQLEAINNASGTEMKLLRAPSMTGKAADRKAWYKASMLWSVSSQTKDPKAAVDLVNWWVNSSECANINLAERGIPANTQILSEITPKLSPAQQGVAKFLADIKPDLGTPVANAPKGGSKLASVMVRYETDVLFGRISTKDAATKFVEEMKSGLG